MPRDAERNTGQPVPRPELDRYPRQNSSEVNYLSVSEVETDLPFPVE